MRCFEDDFFERRRFDIDNSKIKRSNELVKKLNKLQKQLDSANARLMDLELEGRQNSTAYKINMYYLETVKIDIKDYSKELNDLYIDVEPIE